MAAADVHAASTALSHDPSAPQPSANAPGARLDNLDDLLNYDPDDTNRPPAREVRQDDGLGLGLDEEVKVRKARAPTAKLDETRLLSAKGIPALRRITKERLRFKGKGHEFTDVARLLNLYQLWLDDLFPKAKFADGLAIIEKLGHTRRLQVMRKAWIDEDRPKPEDPSDSDGDGDFVDASENAQAGDGEPTEQPSAQHRSTKEEHELYGVASPSARGQQNGEARPAGTSAVGGAADGPEEDELDALLAEDAARAAPPKSNEAVPERQGGQDDFADDEEAMAGVDMEW